MPYTTIQGGKDVTPTNDYLRKYKQYTDYNAFNLYGTYDFSLGDHRFKVMAGFNQESKYKETLDAYSYGQAITDIPAMGSGTSTIKVNDSYDEFAVRGGFFRVNYNYRDKYLLEVNGRYDGSCEAGRRKQATLLIHGRDDRRGGAHGLIAEVDGSARLDIGQPVVVDDLQNGTETRITTLR